MKGALILMLALVATNVARAEDERVCLDATQTRAAMREHKLIDSATAQRTAASKSRAEALRARLCRWNDDFVYEITLLRRDGKVMHVNVRAADGRVDDR